MKLSILIPSLPERSLQLHNLCMELSRQAEELGIHNEMEILIDPHDKTISTGQKRNGLLKLAKGNYSCFFDDDDWPANNYMKRIFEGVEKDVDCISLRGEMTTNGLNPELFEHSLRYSEWGTTNSAIKYIRYPNHLNVIKSSIAKQFKFPEISFGEDHKWSETLHESGLLKTEHYVDEVTYYYKYISNK